MNSDAEYPVEYSNGVFDMSLHYGDCLDIMPTLEAGSIDLVLTDPPYGTTACKWDVVIPLEPMWEQLKRITKPNGAIVLTASQPFTTTLIASNMKMFKYCWVWDKVNRMSGHMNAKKQPLRITEDVAVFYSATPNYYPQMTTGKPYTATSSGHKTSVYGKQTNNIQTVCGGLRYPRNLLGVKADERGTVGRIHPTQKPVALMEYLIKTYTNESETVLDFTMGSGTTGVACKNLNRKFVGIEKDADYLKIASERIQEQDDE